MKLRILALPLSLAVACGPVDNAAELEPPEYAGWGWCPDVQPSQVPGEGELWLQISPSALYCGHPPNEAESMIDVLDARTQLRLVPGDFAIPLEEGTHPIRLQSCERGPRDSTAQAEGSATVVVNEVLGRDRIEVLVEQPLAEGRTLQVALAGWRDQLSPGIVLDGAYRPATVEPYVHLQVCEGPCVPEEDGERVEVTRFDACNLGPDVPRERHRVVGEDGLEVEFTLKNAGDNIRVIAELEHARGTIDGRDFLVSGYFDMALHSYTWSDERTYIVRLEEPVGNVCGIMVQGVYPYNNAVWGGRLIRLRCDGSERTERLVTNEFEIETLEE
jgi:hypothetical protein